MQMVRYLAESAQVKADKLSHKTNVRLLSDNPYLRRYVIRSLGDDQLSPEQIAERLKATPPSELKMLLFHTSQFTSGYMLNKNGCTGIFVGRKRAADKTLQS